MTPLWNRFAPLRSRGIPASSSSAGIPLVFLGAGVVAVVDSVNEPIGVPDDEDTYLASVGVTRYSVYSRNTFILF